MRDLKFYFSFENQLGLDNKSLKHQDNSPQKLKTANPIQAVHRLIFRSAFNYWFASFCEFMRFGGLIFGRILIIIRTLWCVITRYCSKWFEPRSISSLSSVIVRVIVNLR